MDGLIFYLMHFQLVRKPVLYATADTLRHSQGRLYCYSRRLRVTIEWTAGYYWMKKMDAESAIAMWEEVNCNLTQKW